MGGLTKTLVIEAGVVLLLVIADVAALGYFKIVDFPSLFGQNTIVNEQKPKVKINNSIVPTTTAAIPKENAKFYTQRYADEQSELIKIMSNNALHYANNTVEYEGILKDLTFLDQESNTKPAYKVHIVIALGKKGDELEYKIAKEDEEKILFHDKNGIVIPKSNFKTGDKVYVRIIRHTFYQDPHYLFRFVLIKG